jgi:hypothetical protein
LVRGLSMGRVCTECLGTGLMMLINAGFLILSMLSVIENRILLEQIFDILILH